MRMRTSVLAAAGLGVLMPASMASAAMITVDGDTILAMDYNNDTVGDAPSAWSHTGDNIVVTDDANPGAFYGSNYLSTGIGPSGPGTVRHEFYDDAAVDGSGSVLEMTTMLYLPDPGTSENPLYQMNFFNTSGVTTHTSNSPVHTAFWADGASNFQMGFYDGSGWTFPGISIASDQWNELTVTYTVGSDLTVSIDGNSTSGLALNQNSAHDFGIGAVQFWRNDFQEAGPMYLDVVPEPGSLALLGMGGLMLLRRRNR